MADSMLGETLGFLDRLGIFDVVLPFLLVFTIVFAIMEKTKVLGTEKGESRKNLNSMTAFVVSFFVVASSQLVGTISTAMANMVLLLLLSISFMILVGSFHGEQGKDGFQLPDSWKRVFIPLMFVGIITVFLDAIKKDNKSWLQHLFDFLERNWDNEWVLSLFLILAIVGIMAYITGGFSGNKSGESKDD